MDYTRNNNLWFTVWEKLWANKEDNQINYLINKTTWNNNQVGYFQWEKERENFILISQKVHRPWNEKRNEWGVVWGSQSSDGEFLQGKHVTTQKSKEMVLVFSGCKEK